MNLTKDVIRDLLPVYAAGEASPDTRAAVEAALAEDAALRAEVESLSTVPLLDAAPPADLGMASLKRARALLRRRVFLAGFCYAMTTLAAALAGRPWGPEWLGVPVLRLVATACLPVAAAGWLAFLRNTARLRATGFEPPRTWAPFVTWLFGGWWVALCVAAVACDWHPSWAVFHVAVLATSLIWLIAIQVLRPYRKPDEIDRIETLLTLARDRTE